MKRSIFLLVPDAAAGLDTPPAPATAPEPKPAPAAPAPSKEPAPAPSPASEPEPSDDPFERPKPAKAAPAPAAKPAAPAAPAKPDPIDDEKSAPKALREHAKSLRDQNRAFTGKISELEKKIEFLDRRGIDSTAITAQLQAVEKARDEALAELRAARQEASPEFKEKFDKPFTQAAERVKAKIEQLSISEAESGTVRAATWSDFTKLYGMPIGNAIEKANELFGASAPFVIQKLEALHDMDDSRATALQEEREQFKQKTNRDIAEGAKQREGVAKLWDETNTRLSTTNADYKNDPTDTEASDARKHALEVFDTSINAADREDFVKQKVLKDAHVRQKVGAYAVQKLVIQRKDAEIETLKKQVEELKGTAPGGRRPGGAEDEGAPDKGDWGAGLVQHVNKVTT